MEIVLKIVLKTLVCSIYRLLGKHGSAVGVGLVGDVLLCKSENLFCYAVLKSRLISLFKSVVSVCGIALYDIGLDISALCGAAVNLLNLFLNLALRLGEWAVGGLFFSCAPSNNLKQPPQ